MIFRRSISSLPSGTSSSSTCNTNLHKLFETTVGECRSAWYSGVKKCHYSSLCNTDYIKILKNICAHLSSVLYGHLIVWLLFHLEVPDSHFNFLHSSLSFISFNLVFSLFVFEHAYMHMVRGNWDEVPLPVSLFFFFLLFFVLFFIPYERFNCLGWGRRFLTLSFAPFLLWSPSQ